MISTRTYSLPKSLIVAKGSGFGEKSKQSRVDDKHQQNTGPQSH